MVTMLQIRNVTRYNSKIFKWKLVCRMTFFANIRTFLQISLGTVTNVDEAVKWLSYTYLYVRMRMNPLVYGINYKEKEVGRET